MRYLLLIYSNQENWEHPLFLRHPEFLAMPEAERDELVRQSEALRREVTESGELIVAAGLADPVNTRTIRARGGIPVTTDGPFIESKEQLAGYVVVDCESAERAAEIAARIPFAVVEVRPIVDMSGQER